MQYQEINRATFNEVVTDISRLVQQITCLERVETESLEGIANLEMEINVFEAARKPISTYNHNYGKSADKRNLLVDVQSLLKTASSTGSSDQFDGTSMGREGAGRA